MEQMGGGSADSTSTIESQRDQQSQESGIS